MHQSHYSSYQKELAERIVKLATGKTHALESRNDLPVEILLAGGPQRASVDEPTLGRESCNPYFEKVPGVWWEQGFQYLSLFASDYQIVWFLPLVAVSVLLRRQLGARMKYLVAALVIAAIVALFFRSKRAGDPSFKPLDVTNREDRSLEAFYRAYYAESGVKEISIPVIGEVLEAVMRENTRFYKK